ncbi:hypothetical protein LX97_02244 [Nonlabens dokdonensis]|uniref:Lipoprotein n=2 Tax=Nonlabens dokdonensis TaxID=328515 RepID=L7WC98_NONDD|nr:hypothetical protein [Nonlabens dokdonensis]AGC77561.1 hypothetical protein DDD_2434 [Nonlabens dokdonensis DSW-6]PZX39886.1 hypothetical protein LX97_02244 [Nonlabens dokdonensis]
MKFTTLFLFSLFLLSCKNGSKNLEYPQNTISQEQKEKSLNQAIEKEKTKIIDYTKSNLPTYSVQLLGSKYAFITSIDSSYWYKNKVNGMIYDRSTSTTISDSILIRLKSVDSKIIKQNSVFLKSDYPKNSDTKYRGRIHEYIFKNDSIASQSFNKLYGLKQQYPMQWHLSVEWKSPSVLVLKNNKVYHIITGGDYMMGMEKEVQRLIFDN